VSETQRVNILMVDDQPAKLLTYEAILADLDANLIKARSGREGLELLLKHDVAVVLLDVSMPEISGFEMADMMRDHPRFQKTAILFISAVRMSDLDRIRGYQSGAVDYISVPVVPEVLRAKVSIFAELHRKTRELENLNRELEHRVEQRTRELQESENQFRTLANSIPQLAWMADSAGKVFWYNERWYDYTGRSADGVEAEGWGGLLHPEHQDRIVSGRERSLDSAESWEDTFPLLGRNGQYRWFLARAVPIRDSEGLVARWFGTGTDISEQIAMEELLRERADLLELASEAILVRDFAGMVQYWNAGAEALYGWRRGEALGKPVHQVLNTEFPVEPERIESALIEQGRWDGNLVQHTREGQEVIVASRQVFKKETGSILEINRDITAQMRAEEALRSAEKLAAMGRVAGIIAHEINNPLEAITNAFYLLRDHPSLDEEARYYAKLGDGELARVCHITKQTLGFYRESQHPVDVSIAGLLDDVLQLQGRQLLVNRITLDKKYLSHGHIRGFPVELRQVFFNLIGNAIQAMPDGGRLRIRMGEHWNEAAGREDLRISFCDTGAGVQPEHSKHLFEPFFTTKSSKGTGLGLWISKGIIQKYDGTIQFRSMSFKGGNMTAFSVTLPGADPGMKVIAGANHTIPEEVARASRERA
jgi:PAS domain S-box-containing protein